MISLYYANFNNTVRKIRYNKTKSQKGSPEKMKPVLGRPTPAKAQHQRDKCHGGSSPPGTI